MGSLMLETLTGLKRLRGNHRLNGLRRVSFQPIVHKDVGALAFFAHTLDHFAQSLAGFRVLFLDTVVGLEFFHRLLVSAALLQQRANHCEIGGQDLWYCELVRDRWHSSP